jgi:hypothetical protein
MIRHNATTVRSLCAFFGLCTALAFAQPRPLDNISSRQYQHEVRPLRLALDRLLHELGLQDFGLSNACGGASNSMGRQWTALF